MELKEVGEFGLIDLLKKDTIVEPSTVIMGIGDDAAVLLPTPRRLQLLTTDMLVEGIHFDLRTTTPLQLGYKAVAVNLSDIAAMGGAPRHAVVSIALPQAVDVEFIVSLYQGMKEICQEYGVNIVGGDTVSSPQGLVVNVAVLGEVEPVRLQRRSGACVGDLVVVTGTLGNSGGGLAFLLREDWKDCEFAWPLITAHLTPRPQVVAGQLIASFGSSSMDDISDGLASEANEIAVASGVGIRIYADKVPLAPELIQAAAWLNTKPIDYALYGGEDYQLLFTISPENYRILNENDVGASLTIIGEVVDCNTGVRLVAANGSETLLEPKGYNHFR